jgi:uncharacterized protein YutE (UPF0331/DUF86 family)
MIDKNVIVDKASRVERHLKRIREKRNVDLNQFLDDIDLQDIVLFNLQISIQNCIDIASHIISDDELGVAGSTSEIFYILQENGYIDSKLTDKIISAVGFRNLVAHEYGNLDLKIVYKIVHEDIEDIASFIKAILKKCGIV